MTGNYKTDSAALCAILSPDKSFDLINRKLTIGKRSASLFFIDGFIKDEVFEKIIEFLYKITPDELEKVDTMEDFALIKMPYVEVATESDNIKTATAVLSGQAVIIIDGIRDALLVDTRTYPVRAIDEPEKDRSLRGPRDGFVETIIFNTALIRRRIRDPQLRFEYHQIGKSSKVDVAIGFIEDKASPKTVEKLRRRLKSIDIEGISMTSQAISEVILPSVFFNPFPKVRYSERPDFTSACLLEGKVILIMDNSPAVMIFPVSFSDFLKETDDYYFPPITGTYVRIIRFVVSLLTVILTPVMLIFLNNKNLIPPGFDFIYPAEAPALSFFAQFIILEFVIDGLKLASLNTPNTLSSSLGIIGGLILGEFAVEAGWFVPETIIYMAFVAIALFAQPSFEMGYAMKFSRIFLLILSELFGFWGFGFGFAAIILTAGSTKTLCGESYLYPIFPFNIKDFYRMFVRTSIQKQLH